MTHHDDVHEHDLGLPHDLPTVLNRRRALGLLSAAGLAAARDQGRELSSWRADR